MSRTSFFWGVAAGAVGMLLVTISVPGIVPRRPQAKAPRPRPTVLVEGREYRYVVGHAPDERERALLPDEELDGARAEAAEEGAEEDPGRSLLYSQRCAVIATLRNLISAQSQFQSTGRADENNNGIGEYGSFAELSGAAPVRAGQPLDPPVLSKTFRTVAYGRVEREGFYFRIYLPRAGDGLPLPERADGGFEAGAVDPDLAEQMWCAYAWPKDGKACTETFFVSQEGDIIATDGGYVGDREPSPYAAFEPESAGITGKAAVGARGQDGNVWKQAG